ncbi:hypothetical protein PPL_02413 [Heterostelium album PN500]|uniref:Uncharacterized protein n=1 Tax=Heterostelium pallidum (strain ATCC 26659 / Pp 5 / PN500) TaxID=670386 RepID=D3AZN1_HETP5|nr:hypothetical protein PPL_02413 [Heterostelium album PN500]EFA85410.1 hypothetical protein PPL_02413 [Heterostelium album PN500]|eukprot:XP_020437519.1 hypothetical protein PPL_02413 [Heterostelium album PN500]
MEQGWIEERLTFFLDWYDPERQTWHKDLEFGVTFSTAIVVELVIFDRCVWQPLYYCPPPPQIKSTKKRFQSNDVGHWLTFCCKNSVVLSEKQFVWFLIDFRHMQFFRK